MNTILQKRIEEAADAYSQGKPYSYEQGFLQGCEWLLKNQWISVDEALPPIREKDIGNRKWSNWVLVMTHGGSAFVDCYAFHRKEWLNNGNGVTHWAPIPSLKGGEEW